ncbi:MAG: hypothetical protein KJ558_14840, partial [Gammaproteobacteria bacterium]|nr:hypothetical protein [Gammaproteobacteria bacterium]MBU1656064.1 hypothetical protein [Gammaproteobacteria bacterium]MBU1961235.1 hypothetical protein [Gammaproteobacteria bacterium]
MFDEKQFSQLPETSQFLLQLMSVHYSDIAATKLWQLAAQVPNSPFWGSRATGKEVRALLEQLAAGGWVRQLNNTYFDCDPQVRDGLTQHYLRAGRFPEMIKVVAEACRLNEPDRYHGYHAWPSADAALRDLRLHALLGNWTRCGELLDFASRQYGHTPAFQPHPWQTLWGERLDSGWLPHFSDPVLLRLIAPYYLSPNATDTDDDALWSRCRAALRNTPEKSIPWDREGNDYYWQMLIRGELDDPLAAQPEESSGLRMAHWQSFAAAQALCRGDIASALAEYRSGLALLRKAAGRRKAQFGGYLGLFHLLALLLEGTEKSLAEAQGLLTANGDFPVYHLLSHLATALKTGKAVEMPEFTGKLPDHAFLSLLILLVHHWLGQKIQSATLDRAKSQQRLAAGTGCHWLAEEFTALLARLAAQDESYSPPALPLHERLGLRPLFGLYRPVPAWERSLLALQRLGAAGAEPSGKGRTGAAGGQERLIWVLERNKYQGSTSYSLAPKLQKLTKKSGWSGGRNVSLKRLREDPGDFPFLSDSDRRLCLAIEQVANTYYYGGPPYILNIEAAWPALAGHPNVYWADAIHTPLDIQYGREELLILKEGSKLRIRLLPELKGKNDFYAGTHHAGAHRVVEETSTQLRLYKLTSTLLQLHGILGDKGLLVPKEAEASLRRTIESLAPMITIQSDIGGMDNATEVAADPRIHLHLLPWGKGLRLLMRVRPFGEIGPFFPPGAGRANLITEVDNQVLKTLRNLKQERKQAEALLQECPALAGWEDPEDDLLLDEPESCLEALGQLHELGDRIELTWPEGERLRITRQTGQNSLFLQVSHSGDWFELGGKVQVNEGLVLSLRQLLELNRSAVGRFIPLADGQYLTLARQFQKRLETLAAIAETDKRGLKVGALAGLLLEELIEEAGEAETDEHWQRQTRRLKQIRESQPSLPAGLQAELRDYQEEGFRWMARLADWGVGACLADDMGLGKTVQTLALLLTRADKGPALVIAPTSVCNNWYSECQRFAPGLRPIFYRGRDRQQLLEGLQPGDLLICTYGLLQQDAALFQPRPWSTIVLDEAQAIKNTQAKRTQAAYQLQGDFRLVTTGTPIENHLGELWSLFRFLNPGLLLSQQKFNERFIQPIA